MILHNWKRQTATTNLQRSTEMESDIPKIWSTSTSVKFDRELLESVQTIKINTRIDELKTIVTRVGFLFTHCIVSSTVPLEICTKYLIELLLCSIEGIDSSVLAGSAIFATSSDKNVFLNKEETYMFISMMISSSVDGIVFLFFSIICSIENSWLPALALLIIRIKFRSSTQICKSQYSFLAVHD